MAVPTDIRAGTLFLHTRKIDPDWQPGPGEKYVRASGRTLRNP